MFELSLNSSGAWTHTVLYSFAGSPGGDGRQPSSALIFDRNGNLYGTTDFGGSGSCFSGSGCGTVFELTPDGSGEWSEKVLFDFPDRAFGFEPLGSLVTDAESDLYGTTEVGGQYYQGTAFEITLP